jgi:hypothetical protein
MWVQRGYRVTWVQCTGRVQGDVGAEGGYKVTWVQGGYMEGTR